MTIHDIRPKTVTESGDPSFPQLSIETRTLMDALRRVPVGQTITYGVLSQAIGRDVQKAAAHLLGSAQDILERDEQIVFGTVRGIGRRRLAEGEKLGAADMHVRRSRGALKRASRTLAAVDDAALTDDERRAYHARQAQIGAMAVLAKPSSVRRIEAQGAAEALPPAKTLGLFTK